MLVIKGTPDLSLGGSVNVGLEGKRGWFAPLYNSYQEAKQVAARCKVVIFKGSNGAYYMPEGVRGSLVGANTLVGTPYSGKSTTQKIIGLTDESSTNTWKTHVKKKFSVLNPKTNFTEGSWPLSIEKSTRNVGYTGGDTQSMSAGATWRNVPAGVKRKVKAAIAAGEVAVTSRDGGTKIIQISPNDRIYYKSSRGWEATHPDYPGKTGGKILKVDSSGTRVYWATMGSVQ